MKTFRLIGTVLLAMLFCCTYSSCTSSSSKFPVDEYAVDLGLPSGTLWADRNLGADSPEDYGAYLACGETELKGNYNWSTYKWCNGTMSSITKYCTVSYYGYNGFADGKTTLEPSDDAATANWGDEWCMPTYDQFEELVNKCTWTCTTRNGIEGYKVMGPNLNSIFLPAAGCRGNSGLYGTGSYGYYWSSSLNEYLPCHACCLFFNSDDHNLQYSYRSIGHTVRAVVREE